MNKKLIYRILINNFLFIFFEIIFLGLILLGVFDGLMPSNYGAWISYEGYGVVIAGTMAVIICSYVLAYKRYNSSDTTLKSLMKYYNLSFILMMIFLIKLLTLPAFSPVMIIASLFAFFFLLSFFASILHRIQSRGSEK
ncbi:hypothetical protein HYV83_00495 [Candidatus Woesearchaeota archaeon]|nr:hypothetical protein [Candidatus Woesearchaeota archaeon]